MRAKQWWRMQGLVAWAILSGLGQVAWAHTLPISYLTLVPGEEYLHLELVFNLFELKGFTELDANGNQRVDPPEWTAQETNVTRQVSQALTISVDGQVVPAEIMGVTLDPDSHHAAFRAHYPVDVRHVPFRIESTLPSLAGGSHISQVTFRGLLGEERAQLDTQSRSVTFGSAAGSDRSPVPTRFAAAPAGAPEGSRWPFWLAPLGLGLGGGLVILWCWYPGRPLRANARRRETHTPSEL